MTNLLLVFALFGLLSPANRGFLGTVILILYTFLGFVGGYVAARAYKSFGGESWKKLIILTPVLTPGLVFSVFFFLNLFVWFKGSSGAVPFTTMLITVLIWFVISVPLSVAGSWIGLKQPVWLPHVGPSKVFSLADCFRCRLSKAQPEPTKSLVKSHQRLAPSAPCRQPSLQGSSHSLLYSLSFTSSCIPFGRVKSTICLDSSSSATVS